MKSIAILGATGHIAKSIIHSFKDEPNFSLHLFTRSSQKTEAFTQEFGIKNAQIHSYNQFNDYSYSAIINCVGIGDPNRLKTVPDEVFFVTEEIDLMVLLYLRKHSSTCYINFSSGAVHGTEFRNPVTDESVTTIAINALSLSDYYGIAKINAEAKHRALSQLNIIDLRIFGFYSQFLELDRPYLLSEIIRNLQSKQEFVTSKSNIIRDYIHPKDLAELVKHCMSQYSLNCAIDVISKQPISKFEMLDLFSSKFGLKYKVNEESAITSITGSKDNYFSKSKKMEEIGFQPSYTSIECITFVTEEISNSNISK